ncbi:MAG: S8 family peptidase, partial [Polyangiales bacterium]
GLHPAAMSHRHLSALLALALAPAVACGSGSSQRPAPEPAPEPAPATEPETQPEAESSPWDELDAEGLRAYVREHARRRITEDQDDFDVDALDEYLADHESAPALKGKTVERLFDIAVADLAAGELDRAEEIVRLVRDKAKNRNSAFSGNTLLSAIARKDAADEDADAQAEAVAEVLRELPRSRFGPATVVFQVFQRPEQAKAQVAETKTQMLSLETASTVLFFTQVIPDVIEHRDTFLAAIETVQKEHDAKKAPKEHDFGDMKLPRGRGEPVHVAVFDTGVATELEQFADRLYTNEDEEENGEDDDGNGLVDDIHGVVADGDDPNTALLFQPADETLEQYRGFLKGIMDLRAGLASTDAAKEVLALFREITDKDKLIELEKNLDRVGEWAHGTHVAGILMEGNPHARLSVFRSAWVGETRIYFHRGPTDEELAAERENMENIAKYIDDHGVQVVNASIGFSSDYQEAQLRYESDKYETEEQVEERAEHIQDHRREIWKELFEACPDTLFVVAAGNSNRDVVEYGDLPADMDYPNVVSIGAVTEHGEWASFTNSNPEQVRLFDHGVAVPSVVPDGEEVPLSGTSMASPNAANLAAKILAVNPDLEPQKVVEIMLETATPIDEPFNGRITHEKKAIRKARRTR